MFYEYYPSVVIDGIEINDSRSIAANKCTANLKRLERGPSK